MSYFPAFLKLDNKRILIVGGGNIAYEKLLHLLDFTSEIDLIATEYSSQMLELIEKESLQYQKRAYKEGDIALYDIVIISIDNITIQAEIYEESKKYKCLCNAVDSVAYCDFIFPSYIKKDDLIIAVSTSGSSPAVAKHLRRYLQNLIPDSIGAFLREMKELLTTLPKGKERMKMLDSKAQEYIEKWKQ